MKESPIVAAIVLAVIGLHAPGWALLWFGAAVDVLVLAAIDSAIEAVRR